MNFAPVGVSLGGVTVGTIIVALVIQRWWKKGGGGGKGKDSDGSSRDWKELIPFVLANLHGMLLVLCAGGLLGSVAHFALWGVNGLGDLALVYGVGGTSPDVTRARQLALTPGGYAMVLILTALAIGHWKWSKKLPKKQAALGALAGVGLALSGGIAGAAAVPLASAVNLLGTWYSGLVQ